MRYVLSLSCVFPSVNFRENSHSSHHGTLAASNKQRIDATRFLELRPVRSIDSISVPLAFSATIDKSCKWSGRLCRTIDRSAEISHCGKDCEARRGSARISTDTFPVSIVCYWRILQKIVVIDREPRLDILAHRSLRRFSVHRIEIDRPPFRFKPLLRGDYEIRKPRDCEEQQWRSRLTADYRFFLRFFGHFR